MKDRIVIWGQDEKDEDILIAIRLLQDSDIIKIWTFPKKDADAEFVAQLFQEWKDGAEDSFPQPHQLIERGISEENMLPESIKTPKTDVIKIAEQEWRVRVLSFRLYQHIKQQIEQLDTRASNLSIFSKDVWEEAKDVSRSIKENTLDRNIKKRQTTELRNSLDAVFDKLKKLQNAEQEKFLGVSKGYLGDYRQKISEVADQIGKGNTGKKLFDQLVRYQQEVKGVDMTIRDRNALRLNFNEAFEALKASRQSNFGNRMNARVNGLKSAIGKMEASIKRDKDNVNYQSGRINKNNTTQLEYQLRSAKLKLIEDRIHSKEQKLHNMYLTLKDLEKKATKATAKAQKGVLAATTNNKKAKPKTEKVAEAKNEVPQSEAAQIEPTTESQKEVVANEAAPKQEINVKEEASTQVAAKQEEVVAPAAGANSTEEAKPVENKESKTDEVMVDNSVAAEKEVVTEVNVTKDEVEESKTEEVTVDNSPKEEKEAVEEKDTVEESKATEETKADESKPIADTVTKAVDNITEKADHSIAGIAVSAAAVAGGLGLAATGKAASESPASDGLQDVSTSINEKETPVEVNPIKEEVLETKAVTDNSDVAQTNEVESKTDEVTADSTSTLEKEPAVEVNQSNEEVVETKTENEANHSEETKATEPDAIVNPVTEVADKLKEKADHTITGITASAAAVAGGLGLSAASGNNTNAESSASESLPDVPSVSEVKEQVETTIKNPVSEAEIKEPIVDQITENITDASKEEE